MKDSWEGHQTETWMTSQGTQAHAGNGAQELSHLVGGVNMTHKPCPAGEQPPVHTG